MVCILWLSLLFSACVCSSECHCSLLHYSCQQWARDCVCLANRFVCVWGGGVMVVLEKWSLILDIVTWYKSESYFLSLFPHSLQFLRSSCRIQLRPPHLLRPSRNPMTPTWWEIAHPLKHIRLWPPTLHQVRTVTLVQPWPMTHSTGFRSCYSIIFNCTVHTHTSWIFTSSIETCYTHKISWSC